MTRDEAQARIDGFGRPVTRLGQRTSKSFVRGSKIIREMQASIAAQRDWDALHPQEAAEIRRLQERIDDLDAAAAKLETLYASERRAQDALKRGGTGHETFAALENPRPTKALDEVLTWLAATPPSWCIVLRGDVGTGKSFAARKALLEAGRGLGLSGEFRRVSEVLRLSAFEDGAREFRHLKAVPFLVLDDVGADHLSDYGRGLLNELLDARHELKLRTVITANPEWSVLVDRLGQRIADRIRAGGVVVNLSGRSLRQTVPQTSAGTAAKPKTSDVLTSSEAP